MQGARGPLDPQVERRYVAVCWVRGARRAALWGGGGATMHVPALPANPGFRNSRLHFRPPALLCKPRIPKFPITLPAPSAPCKVPRIPKFPITLPAPSATCKPRIPKFPITLPAPSAPLQTRYTCTLAQIPNSNPGPKAPKAKMFRIPRVRRLNLHFPPCNVTQPASRVCPGSPRCLFTGTGRTTQGEPVQGDSRAHPPHGATATNKIKYKIGIRVARRAPRSGADPLCTVRCTR